MPDVHPTNLRVRIAAGTVLAIERELGGRCGAVTDVVEYHGEVAFVVELDDDLPEWAQGWDISRPRKLLVDVTSVEPESEASE